MESSVYQLNISLIGAKPPIWRRLLVPGNLTLDDLHCIIQCSMVWDDAHSHGFDYQGQHFAPGEALEEDDIDTSITLAALNLKENSQFVYTYDDGDNWEHQILVEKILAADSQVEYPRCVAGKRASPPEDCGGVGGYETMLAILKDQKHHQHEEKLEWVGEGFNPDCCDVDTINANLRALYFT